MGQSMPELNRREFLAASAGLSASSAQAAAPPRPNILFVMVDEMRWDAMSCVQHPVVETPNLDRLARQATLFRNSYTVSPVCCPARASVFSGRYAHVHGVTSNGLPANDGEIFLPSILRHYGYHTAISGKLHYAPKRYDYGFDQFWSFTNEGPTPELGLMAHLKNKHGAPGKFPILPGTCPWPDDPLGKDVGIFKYGAEDFETEWLTDRSIDYLRSRQGKSQPWFLFTSYLKPHSPSVEPEPWFGKYRPQDMKVPPLPPNAREIRASKTGQRRRHYVDNVEMMKFMTAIYYGMIAHVDQQIGRLFGELERLGMADNTLILFTADHGNMLGDHGRWFKGVQYEGSAHVPLIWRGPKGSPTNDGRAVDQVVENTDLVPSILETAGIPVPEGVQGRSFLKMMSGQDPQWKNRCYSQLTAGSFLEGGFKLIDNSLDCTGERELYDLRNDPREARNLAADPKHRERVAHFCQELTAWRARRPVPIQVAGMSMPAYAHISPAERKELRESAPE
jgi:arylsulfatase A-like enzyme